MEIDNLLVSGAVVFKKEGAKLLWFLVRHETDGEWEFPKAHARKGESSVRAVIREMAESGGMQAKVLEEVGRAGGATTVNKKVVPVRYLYYLMIEQNFSGETIGFAEHQWMEYAAASRKISSKREGQMLKSARDLLKKLEKEDKAE